MTPFRKGLALNIHGALVPAWGFDCNGAFIVNARVSECGRFHVAPQQYGQSEQRADHLKLLNSGRELLAYWEI